MNGSLKSTLVCFFSSFFFFFPLDQAAAPQIFFQMGTKSSSEKAFEDDAWRSATQSAEDKTIYIHCEVWHKLLTG